MEDLVFFTEWVEELTLYSVVGIGAEAVEIISLLKQHDLRLTTFWSSMVGQNAINEYVATANREFDKEKDAHKVLILVIDLSMDVDCETLLVLILSAKKKGQLVVLVGTMPCSWEEESHRVKKMIREIEDHVDMLLITDKEKLHRRLSPCSASHLQEEVRRILCQQIKDLVQTCAVAGIILIDFPSQKAFIRSSPPHAAYFSGYGIGEQRVQKAIEAMLDSSVSYFSSEMSATELYFMVQYNDQYPMEREEMAAIMEQLPYFHENKSFTFGVQRTNDFTEGIRIFMFAKATC